jgi:hypothetical protein
MFFSCGEALSTVAWLETAERAYYVLGRFVEVAMLSHAAADLAARHVREQDTYHTMEVLKTCLL